MIGNFISNAKGLTKNPLGIIALFISLIYGFACLVLSTSISNLYGDCERLPLIWFIIGFPIIILLAFIFLVVKHHEKLYSPSDYRDDEAFIQTVGKEKIKERQLKEVKQLELAKTKEISTTKQINSLDTIVEKSETIEKPIKTETEEDLLKIYKNAELWVTKELSLKYHVVFRNNLVFSIQSGKIELDAFGKTENQSFIAEIKYWKSNKSDKNLRLSVQEFLSQHKRLETAFGRNREFKLIVAFVFDSLHNINKNDLMDFVKNIYSEANVEFFDYEELRKSYE